MNSFRTFALSCLLLWSGGIFAADRITVTVTVTNLPATGDTFTLNGAARYWTNETTISTIATNETELSATTNLWNQILQYPYSAPLIPNWLTATQFTLLGGIGADVSAGESGEWAAFSYTTQTVQRAFPVSVPLGNQPTPSQATNIASQLASDLSGYSTTAIDTNAVILSGYVSTNGVFYGYIVSAPEISGTVLGLTNGIYITPKLSSPTTTNLVNYGNAIRSFGTEATSQQFGVGAQATNDLALAVGGVAIAGGVGSTALGAGAKALGENSTSTGSGSMATNEGSSAYGQLSRAYGMNSLAMGYAAVAIHSNSIVIATSAESTAADQVLFGNAAHSVIVSGVLSAASQTNSTFTGTNQVNGSLGFTRSTVETIADGNNTIAIPDYCVYVSLTGSPSATWTNCAMSGTLWDGRYIILENGTGQNMTIAHASGFDGTAARRLLTYTEADVVTTGRRISTWIYNGASSRWVLITP